MKKGAHLIIVLLILIYGCQNNPVVKTHGISYLENREKLIIVNKSNKNDIVNILGQPATKGMVDDNLWIYIERQKSRGMKLKKKILYIVFYQVLDKKWIRKKNKNLMSYYS